LEYFNGQLLAVAPTTINALTSGRSQFSSNESECVKQIMNCHFNTEF